MYLCCNRSKDSTVRANVEKLRQAGALDYTIVAASAADPAPLLYIAPYSGVTMVKSSCLMENMFLSFTMI